MIEIRNKVIPFGKRSIAMNVLGFLFVKRTLSLQSYNHEAIHTAQQYELFALGAVISLVLCNLWHSWAYLLWLPTIPITAYILGFITELILPPYKISVNISRHDNLCVIVRKLFLLLADFWNEAYENNCFEREAYACEVDMNYLIKRNPFAFVKYILKRKERI